MPQRIQRKRTKGWKMPEGAVYVGRPTRWGNPYSVGTSVERDGPLWRHLAWAIYGVGGENFAALDGFTSIRPARARQVVDAYSWWLYEQPVLMLSLAELAGRDLVCWCDPFDPCHADVLLSIANPEENP